MRLVKNKFWMNTIVMLNIAGTILFSYSMTTGDSVFGHLWIAAGFAAGTTLLFGKKTLPGVIHGIFLGHIASRLLLFNEPLWFSSVYGLITIGADIGFVMLFIFIINGRNFERELNARNILYYVASLFIPSFLYGIVTSVFYYIFYPETVLFDLTISNTLGHFFGGLLIGTVILLSHQYDKHDTTKPSFLSFGFLIVFTTITYFLFKGVGDFNFQNFAYIYILIFLISSNIFSYRMLLIIIMIYLLAAHTGYLPNLDPAVQGYHTIQVNVFLVILVLAVSVVRMLVLEQKIINQELIRSNNKIEDMVESTFSLLRLSEESRLDEENFNGEDFLKDVFSIGTTIFTNFDKASCYIKGEEFVKFVDGKNYDLNYLNSFGFRIEEFEWVKNVPEHILGAKKMVQLSLRGRYDKFIEKTEELHESIKFTIFIDDDTIGGISFDIVEGSERFFTNSDYENIKSFQRIMNSYYETKRLISRNNTLRDEIVLSLIQTLELYDQYTGGHSEEVAHLSSVIAKRLGYSDQEVNDIYWAGIVHDIGKVGIPSEILNKPDKLSLEEYEKIKAHPGFGYDILNKSKDLKHIAKIVKHHHEWYNGSGYPTGLIGDDIPRGSRIIMVADAVSSMATKRPYTEIKTSNEILDELKLYKGSQFCPEACEEMIKFIQEGKLDEYYLTVREQ